LCPFHKEKTPSFQIDSDRQRYRCWSCGASGDVFQFIQDIENLDFRGAKKRVAELAGIPLNDRVPWSSEQRRQYASVSRQAATLASECAWTVTELRRRIVEETVSIYKADREFDQLLSQSPDDELLWLYAQVVLLPLLEGAHELEKSLALLDTASPDAIMRAYVQFRQEGQWTKRQRSLFNCDRRFFGFLDSLGGAA
jgi:hypothetical protein